MSEVQCPFCDGTGETALGGVCANCGGTGNTSQKALDDIAHTTRTESRRHDSGVETEIDGPRRKKMETYHVGIKTLSDRPVASAGGDLTREVVYSIATGDSAISDDWNGGLVQGETLKRCLRIKEVGEIVVTEPTDWGDHRPDQWQEIIVNLALDRSSSESA